MQQLLMVQFDNPPEIRFRNKEGSDFLQAIQDENYPGALMNKKLQVRDILLPILDVSSESL